MQLPKVLIFGPTFNRITGGGITLSNLFNGWDKDKIALTSYGNMLISSTTDICNTYYQLGSQEHKWIFPFHKFQRVYTSGILKINNVNQEYFGSHKKTGLRKKFIDYCFYPFLRYFGFFHFISSLKISNQLCDWLNNFKPDLLYIQVSEREGILFAQQLHSYLKIPMIIHIMDDWPSTISSKGLFKNYWHRKIDSEFRYLLDQASLLMSISEDMAAEYMIRYGKTFLSFHNPINIDFWKKHQKSNYELNNPPKILYAGRIGMGINNSLELIAKAIMIVNEELGMSVEFILQTPEKRNWFSNYECTIHKPLIPYSDLPKTFAEADILVMPYDFSKESIMFIRFSMPTKVPEYMMSGAPIIVFAPETTTVAKYAKETKWALTITEQNLIKLSNSIKLLLQNKDIRETISTNAKQIAEKNYNSLIINDHFRETICSLTNNINKK